MIVIAAKQRMLAAGVALGLFLPQIAEADGVRMLEFCKHSNREIVIAYVSGALERADMDSDTIAAALEGALERSEIEKFGLKKAWVAVRNWSSVKNSQVVDLESGNGMLLRSSLPGIGSFEGDSLQT